MYYFRKTRLFSSHEPSPAKHSQNIPKTFSKHTVGHVAFRVRWRSIIGLAHERKRRSIDGSRFGTFFASTHILRPRRAFRQPTFFRRVRWTFSTGRRRFVSSFRTHAHEPPRRVRHPHPAQPRTCASPRPAPRASRQARAARREHAPAPAFAVVAPAKRFDATEHDARCVRARYASPTREGDPDERDAREPPAGTRKLHRARPPPPTAPRSSPSRRRAAPFRARVRRRFVFSAPRNNRSRPRRAPETARARAVAPRALRAVDVDTRTSAETRRGRGGALAFARPSLRHDARPRDDTRLTRAPLFQRKPRMYEPPFTRENRCAANSLLARAGVAPSRTCAAAARCRFSVTPPAFA